MNNKILSILTDAKNEPKLITMYFLISFSHAQQTLEFIEAYW